jgi:hypothetical protein
MIKNFIKYTQSVQLNIVYSIFAKILSLFAVYLIFKEYPKEFKEYSEASIVGGLVGGVTILGFIYMVQMWSQDIQKFSPKKVVVVNILYGSLSFIVSSVLEFYTVVFFAILISGSAAIWLAHLYEVSSNKMAYTVQSILIILIQPSIYLFTLNDQYSSLNSSNLEFYLSIVIFIVTSTLFFRYFKVYMKLFLYQSFTILLGGGVIAYYLSDSVLNDPLLNTGILWLVVQLSSGLMFIVNNLSFHLIKTFSEKYKIEKVKFLQAIENIYIFIVIFFLILYTIMEVDNNAAIYCYALYLLIQGLAKVSGSAILSLRSPNLQLISAIATLLFVLVYVFTFGPIINFSDSFSIALIGSIGGSLSLIYVLRKKIKVEKT